MTTTSSRWEDGKASRAGVLDAPARPRPTTLANPRLDGWRSAHLARGWARGRMRRGPPGIRGASSVDAESAPLSVLFFVTVAVVEALSSQRRQPFGRILGQTLVGAPGHVSAQDSQR